MRLVVLDEAEDDLLAGRDFYDRQDERAGEYFAASLAADIESLRLYAGIHPERFGFQRALSKRFPFGIYYLVLSDTVQIHAVLDLRRSPAWIRKRLGGGVP